MSILKTTTAIALFTILGALALPAHAQDSMMKDSMEKTTITEAAMAKDSMMKKSSAPVSFEKKSFKVNGSYSVMEENGQTIIRLSEDFKTKAGPDLKIFLSPQSSASVSGSTAVNGAVLLGALKSNKGGSDYIVPAGVTLSDFQSVLVHCQAYSKLWAAADLS